MLRRCLALALMLNLIALVPTPLAACAVLSGLGGPCQCSTPTRCGPELARQNRRSGPSISCRCIQAGGPFPQAVQNSTNAAPVAVTVGLVVPAAASAGIVRTSAPGTAFTSQFGPPGGRAGLCVFLI